MFSNELICNILDFIDININSKISIDVLAKRFSYNRFYLMKLFKKELKISIIDYINSLRIYNSLKDIKYKSFLNLALDNGFYSLEYYDEIFKKVLGINPRTYKKIINYDRTINENNLIIYLEKISNLNILIENINKYKRNKKTTNTQIKVLSIFKEKTF